MKGSKLPLAQWLATANLTRGALSIWFEGSTLKQGKAKRSGADLVAQVRKALIENQQRFTVLPGIRPDAAAYGKTSCSNLTF